MVKRLVLKKEKMIYFAKVFIIVSTIAFSFAIFSSLFNKNSVYTPGKMMISDDTGHTIYSSGWPKRFYSYKSQIGNKATHAIKDSNVEIFNFIYNVVIFYIPSFIIYIFGLLIYNEYLKKNFKAIYKQIRKRE